MSLILLQETVPITYELCQDGDGAFYNPHLCTPPRKYREEFNNNTNSIDGFWYDPNKDRYMMRVLMAFSLWPSWRVNVYEIHPETGIAVRDEELSASASLGVGLSAYETGEFNKVYAIVTSGSFEAIHELDPATLNAGPKVLDENDIPTSVIKKFLLNRQNRLVLVADTVVASTYNYQTSTLIGQLSMPTLTISDLAYEDNERGWAVMPGFDGLPTVVKFNYKNPKFEMVTALQPSTLPDQQTLIAYDSRRKIVAIFRQHEEAIDGAATHTLGLYKPIPVATALTDPVPMSRLQPGKVVTMVAHLHGDRGEVGQGKPVTVVNSGDGTILQPTVIPQINGAVVFQYLCGPNPGTDTITLQVDL